MYMKIMCLFSQHSQHFISTSLSTLSRCANKTIFIRQIDPEPLKLLNQFLRKNICSTCLKIVILYRLCPPILFSPFTHTKFKIIFASQGCWYAPFLLVLVKMVLHSLRHDMFKDKKKKTARCLKFVHRRCRQEGPKTKQRWMHLPINMYINSHFFAR